MKTVETLLGLLLVVVFGLALRLALQPGGDELHATLPGAGPYLVSTGGSGASEIQIGPPELLPRLATSSWGGGGLTLSTWSVNYGNRWQRAVTAAELAGPLEAEGERWCGIAARISPGVLDPAQAGDGMIALVRRELDKVLPMSLPCGFTSGVFLSRPKTVSLRLKPHAGIIDVEAIAVLNDGTRVGAASAIRLTSQDGRLVVERTAGVQPLFDGPGRAACEGSLKVQLGNLWWRFIEGRNESIVISMARAEMTRRVTPALDVLNRALSQLSEPFAPIPGREDRIALSLARPPVVDEQGIALSLCAEVALGDPRIDTAIGGPPRQSAPPPPMPPAAEGPRIDLALNREALNRLLYILWQTGQLRQWGTSTAIMDQLPPDIRALAFDVTGFDPLLPPLIHGDELHGDELHVTAANIAVGQWDERTVLGHATGRLRLASRGPAVIITADIDHVAVSCAARARAGWRISPCLSELLPMVGEQVVDYPPELHIDTGVILQAIAAHTLNGLSMKLSAPVVSLLPGGNIGATMTARIDSQ